jgi:hypothetical protein
MPYSYTIKTRTLEDAITEPHGTLGFFQEFLGYASLPLRIRHAARKILGKNNGVHTINIYYDPQSTTWRTYLYGTDNTKIIPEAQGDQRSILEAQDRRRNLEGWLTQTLNRTYAPGNPSRFLAVGIYPIDQFPDRNLPRWNGFSEFFAIYLDNPAELGENLMNCLRGVNALIKTDGTSIPIGRYSLRFLEPNDPTKNCPMDTSPFFIGTRMLPCKNVVCTYPLVGDQHAALYWGGGRFWITPLAPYCLYTGSGGLYTDSGRRDWNLLRPDEYRLLPISSQENEEPFLILLGQIDDNYQPIRGSAILQYFFPDM